MGTRLRGFLCTLGRLVGNLTCRHQWRETTILGVGANEFSDLRACQKCKRVDTLFTGTRNQWRKHHGFPVSNVSNDVSGRSEADER